MKTISRPVLEAIARRNMQELDHSRDWQNVRCPYCLDNQHLAIEPEWAKQGYIPNDVDTECYYIPLRDPFLFYVPCDCHNGLTGKDDDGKTVKRFQDFFGQNIKIHPYGRALMQVRHGLMSRKNEVYKPGSDGHMHVSEAWEVLDADIPDPPEHVLEGWI